MQGKQMHELIREGTDKLASVSAGKLFILLDSFPSTLGGAPAGVAAAAGDAPAAKEEPKKKEEEVAEDIDLGGGLFGDDDGY